MGTSVPLARAILVTCLAVLSWLVLTLASLACDVWLPAPYNYTQTAEHVFRGRVIAFWGLPISDSRPFGYMRSRFASPDEVSLTGWLRVEKVFKGRVPYYLPFRSVRGNSCQAGPVYIGQELYVVDRSSGRIVRLHDAGPFPMNHHPNPQWKNFLGLLGLTEQQRILRQTAH